MPSPLVHFQIASSEPEATQAFLSALFDWEFHAGSRRVIATIDTGARKVEPNDIYPSGTLIQVRPGTASYASLFFRVIDLDSTVARAVSLGGSVVVPRTRTPEGTDIAIISTPQGHVIGIVQQ